MYKCLQVVVCLPKTVDAGGLNGKSDLGATALFRKRLRLAEKRKGLAVFSPEMVNLNRGFSLNLGECADVPGPNLGKLRPVGASLLTDTLFSLITTKY